MILTITSRVFLMLSVLAALVALPSYLKVEAQRQQDNRALRMQEVKELPAKAKRYALVIGVDEYQDEQISGLSGATNDAKALADALVRYAGFPADQVILLASDQPQQRQPSLQTYTETAGGVGIEMLRVPSGKFLMGSPSGTGDSDEHPQHEVTVSSFWMGKYEVTQAQWRAVVRLPKVGMELTPEPSNFKGDDLPVERVSWDEAVEFCARLSHATGKTYRLPTEAEWEYACLANTRVDYKRDLDEMAWYAHNSAKTTHSVGRKRANGFGLYDMHGNVWEWCRDWYSENYYLQSPSEDPRGPNGGSSRVARGGSWSGDARNCRSANRNKSSPVNRIHLTGFRVVAAARTP